MIKIKNNGQKVWVTFTYSAADTVNDVAISGEWNEWKEEAMKEKKNGDYYITKIFKLGDSFQFGYKVNGNDWITEEECTSVSSPYASHNSLVTL